MRKQVREKNIELNKLKSDIQIANLQQEFKLKELKNKYYNEINNIKEKHEKEILRVKKETTDEVKRMFIEYGNDFLDELGVE